MNVGSAIEWIEFGKRYPKTDRWAVKETTLTIRKGAVFGIFGRNGSGKTTLMRAAAGLIRPTVGCVKVDGRPVTRASLASGHVVGYMPQRSLSLNSLTVGESIRCFSKINDLTKVNQDLRDAVIEDLGVSTLWGKSVRSLSGGQAKLTQFAVSFCTNSDVLVLDEPTNELDTINRRKLWAAIGKANNAGKTIAVVSHNILEAADVVTDVAIVHQGIIALCGPAQQIINESSTMLTLRYTSPDSRERYDEVSELSAHSVPTRIEELIRDGVTDISVGPPQLEEIFCRVVDNQ